MKNDVLNIIAKISETSVDMGIEKEITCSHL